MRTETAKELEIAARLHQYAQERMKAYRKEFADWGAPYDWKLSQSIVAGLRDAYRRVFEEGYFGRTIHDVTSFYNNNPNKMGRGDDDQLKKNDNKQDQGNGMSM